MVQPLADTALPVAPASKLQLWGEFLLFFAAFPIILAVFFGSYPLLTVLLIFTGLAIYLLRRTPGVARQDIFGGEVLRHWRLIAGFGALSLIFSFALAYALVPDRVLSLPLYRPDLWLMIMVIYPVASALPQEIIYRVLFFRRYGALFANRHLAVAVNGLAFGMAHLFFLNPVTIGLTVLAGLVFGWVYQRHGSLLLVTVLHGIAGQIIFTSGLGIYFYHGAIGHTP